MSGIYIPGMEIPKDDTVLLRVFPASENGELYTQQLDIDGDVLAELWAVPVPDHGRLIDADAFEKENAYFWGRDFINAKYEDCLCDLVNAAPTIIPADKEGEG